MNQTFPGTQPQNLSIENLQDFYSRTLEYYDELFPLDEQIISCLLRLNETLKKASSISPPPIMRFLGVGSATGTLENRLSIHNFDITGIDTNPAMVSTAKRRIKSTFSSIRFFEMNSLDMRRFLKEGSFNIIACVENTLPYIGDETLVRKFFHDARTLLAPEGYLLLQTHNFGTKLADKPVRLPDRSSIRVRLSRTLIPAENNKMNLDAQLELGNGQLLQLQNTTEILQLTIPQVTAYALEAGFASTSVYSDFNESPYDPKSPHSVYILQA
ncbi:MAG TPA: class I SAM-dependent methyltransferase [Treponema sp.]|nr:class I SAM-dependent methyltransferase [Treponema sp.]